MLVLKKIQIFGWEQKTSYDGEYLFVVMECGEKDLGTLLKELSAQNKGLTDNKIKFYWEDKRSKSKNPLTFFVKQAKLPRL